MVKDTRKFDNKVYAYAGSLHYKKDAEHRAQTWRDRGFNARVVKSDLKTTGSYIAHYPKPDKKITVDIYKIYVRKQRKV